MIETIESDFIHDGTGDNFSNLVIDNSNLGPVLVNFWSRHAGPCLRQYPILDKLVHEYSGRLLLINVDTEKEVIISKNYGIASVPTLKIFRFGEVKDTLHGYQDEADLKKLIDKYVTRDSDNVIEQAIQEYSQGNHEKAYQLLSDAIMEDQVNPRLPLTICKLLKHEGRFDEALTLLASLPTDLKSDLEISLLSNQLFFIAIVESIGDIKLLLENTEKDNVLHHQQISAHYVIENEFELALIELEKIILLDRNFDNDYARKAMLKIFEINDDEILVQKFRPLLLKYTH